MNLSIKGTCTSDLNIYLHVSVKMLNMESSNQLAHSLQSIQYMQYTEIYL